MTARTATQEVMQVHGFERAAVESEAEVVAQVYDYSHIRAMVSGDGGDLLRSFKPLHDRVLVERVAAETKTKGGIMLPEKAQGKVLEATVISVGPGGRNEKGELIPMSVKAGDHVLLPEYGGTKVIVEEKEYSIFREQDLLGVFI
ncbi:unnamed protein product [Cylicocyclus nassatus]|uniref:10 kDa heat shock protein, mitochondrial n=1 Tax=Cylicocyclus nassatus TaxID=53992 RepID=A0AA36GVK4_CYLNA|nr:unnamed protein product [Cylicocyclus nassatus]